MKYPHFESATSANVSRFRGERVISLIEKALKESKAIDLESLCVLSGESVWKLSVHLSVLQSDGNVIDAANLAVLAALKHHRFVCFFCVCTLCALFG